MRALLLISCAYTFAVIGCGGDDPVSFSDRVGINLKAKSGDAKNGVVSDEKGITTESGNPFGKFVDDAEDALGGNEPTLVELASLDLTLGANSKNVTALEQIFSGEVEALFLIDDTKNSFIVGKTTSPEGGGPIAMSVTFDWSELNDADREKFFNGSFKVVVRGDVVDGFDKSDADADLQLTFTFAAFE